MYTITFMCMCAEGLQTLFDDEEKQRTSAPQRYAFINLSYQMDFGMIEGMQDAIYAIVGQIIGPSEYFNK